MFGFVLHFDRSRRGLTDNGRRCRFRWLHKRGVEYTHIAVMCRGPTVVERLDFTLIYHLNCPRRLRAHITH